MIFQGRDQVAKRPETQCIRHCRGAINNMSEVSFEKIDEVVKKLNEKSWITLRPFEIVYARRVNNVIYVKGITHVGRGEIVSLDSGVRIKFEYKMRTHIMLFFLVPVTFLCSIFFLPQVTINGNSNPSFIEKLIFCLGGLASVCVVYLILQRGRRIIIDEVKKAFSL